METLKTPKTRAEFERRFHLLREQIRQGRMLFANDMRSGISGIEKVRYLPNGRVDFLSVSESARLQANMTIQFESEAFKAMVKNRGTQGVPEGNAQEETGEMSEE